MDSPPDGFWNSLGPWFLGGLVTLIGVIYAIFRDDISWLKRNLTRVLVKLGMDPE